MTALDIIGLIAGIFVVLAFYCVDQRRMRRFAIASNLVFIVYAWSLALGPILVLHATFLPLNLIRLWQLSGRRRRCFERPMTLERRIDMAEADLRIALGGQPRVWASHW